MRTRWSGVAVGCLCGVFVNCSGSDDAAAPGGGDDAGVVADGAQPNEASTPTDSGSDSGPNFSRVDVAGTLNGRASDNGPLASRDVIVIGADGVVAKTSTDGNGKFSASGVATPYDVGIPYFPTDAGAPAYPSYYAGISRPDPIVNGKDYNVGVPPVDYQATLTWSADVPVGSTMILATPNTIPIKLPGAGPASPFSHAIGWTGSSSINEPLHFYVKDGTGAYTNYFDIPSQALADSTPVALGTITPTTVTSGSFTLSATVSSSYLLQDVSFLVVAPDGTYIDESAGTVTAIGQYPVLPNVLLTLFADSNGPSAEQSDAVGDVLAASASSATITLPVAIEQLTPTNHSSGIPLSQGLTWSAFATPRVYTGTIGAGAGPSLTFYTATPAIDFSKFAKAGMALAPATTYTWAVSADGLATKMDDFVVTTTPGTPYHDAKTTAPGVLTYFVASVSGGQTFTTQ